MNEPRKVIDIIACDGASDFLKMSRVTPDVIIGDLDSAKSATLKYFSKRNVTIKRIRDQYKTDMEKAILYALSKNYSEINIIGLSGKRLDHTLNNISVLKKYYRKAVIKIYENGFEGIIINKTITLDCKIGDTISLIPLPKASGITTVGLKYPLKNGNLELGVMTGALNESVSEIVKISVRKGLIFILKNNKNKYGFPHSPQWGHKQE